MQYKQPQKVPVQKMPDAGYPNNVPNTQTVKTRGTGAAIKGTKSSKKLG
jgi:hypothetical protein